MEMIYSLKLLVLKEVLIESVHNTLVQ